MTVEVRAVTDAERSRVYRLRYDVFVQEFGLRVEADHARHWVYEGDRDDRATIIGAFVDGQLVGSARIVWGGSQTFTDKDRREYHVDIFLTALPPAPNFRSSTTLC